jgi:hypothetical protein
MVRFFLKLLSLVCLVTIPYFLVQYKFMKNEDPFYWKATHQAEHLIIGGSRALKGIFPSVIGPELGLEEGEMLNFAFTGVLSPYGPKYSHAIKRKLKPTDKTRIFILSVCPGNVMDFSEATEKRENGFRFYQLWTMNTHPNYEYVLRHPRSGKSLVEEWCHVRDKKNITGRVFTDGAKGTYLPKNYQAIEKEKVIRFALERSLEREEALNRLVAFLSEMGDVFLVRMPVSTKTFTEEDEIYPAFNANMEALANNYRSAKYLNYTSTVERDSFRYSDGNHHLEGSSAEHFSYILAQDIKSAGQK